MHLSPLNEMVYMWTDTMNAKNKIASYLPLAAVLTAAGMLAVVPFQAASAQTEEARFLIRLVQGTAQTGLVNVSIQVGNVIVNDVVDVNRNNIAIPITIPVAANVNVGAQVCATVLSSGDQVCEFVQNVDQDAINRVILDLTQAQ
jgi:hypothetical protein